MGAMHANSAGIEVASRNAFLWACCQEQSWLLDRAQSAVSKTSLFGAAPQRWRRKLGAGLILASRHQLLSQANEKPAGGWARSPRAGLSVWSMADTPNNTKLDPLKEWSCGARMG